MASWGGFCVDGLCFGWTVRFVESSCVLVADDDPAILSSLSRALRLAGYQVLTAPDGVQAQRIWLEQAVDVCVLDVMMPGLDGLELTRRMRAAGVATPVLVLTARVEVDDRVAGLDAGADDYLAKPFDLAELQARLRALLRRAPLSSSSVLSAFGVEVDLGRRLAFRSGRPLQLTRIEFDLLAAFVAAPSVVLTQSELYEKVWGYDFGRSSKNLSV